MAEGQTETVRVTPGLLGKFLGAAKTLPEERLKKDTIGIATGLAWTATGGDVLFVEASIMKGKGRLTLTGQLGDVMKESAQAALSWARSHARAHGIKDEVFAANDLHVHVPEGAIPKDGPSAGITMATAILSALTGQAVRSGLAMTGEITLRGQVLPIGGLKEKILAARRAHIETVVCPKLNKKDLDEVPVHLRRGMNVPPGRRRGGGARPGPRPARGAEGPHGHEDPAAPVPGTSPAPRHGLAEPLGGVRGGGRYLPPQSQRRMSGRIAPPCWSLCAPSPHSCFTS